MQEHFNNRNSGADVSGHDVKSLKAKIIRFKTRGTLPKLGFVSANKPLLMAFYHSNGVQQGFPKRGDFSKLGGDFKFLAVISF